MEKFKSIMKKAAAIAIALLIGVFCILYFVSYEDGYWAGKVLSVSKKGFLFKTHEGRVSMESFGALKNTNPIAETRDFSVESSSEEVLKELERVALTGERVNLKFKRMFVRFFWRGDTKYFVTGVERLSPATQPPATPQTP